MARVFTQAEGKRLGLPGRSSLEIVSGEKGSRAVTLLLVELAVAKPGDKPRAPHWHRDFEECIYVLSGEGETHATALTESCHHAACAPIIFQPTHRADQGIAVRSECKRPIDDFLDAGLFECGKVLKRDLERRHDPLDVGLQQLVAEGPRRLVLGPGLARLLVGADEHPASFLAQVELAVEIDGVDDLPARAAVDRER